MSRPATRDRFEDYVPVAERIEKFYERFSDGRILTTIIEHDKEVGFVLIRAEIYRHADDASPAATGHAYEYKDSGYVQKTSYIEVAETSAVGRGLAFLNFETKRGIASREEMEQATRSIPAKPAEEIKQRGAPAAATKEQKEQILLLLETLRPKDRRAQRKILTELTGKQSRDDLTQEEAQRFIAALEQGDF